MQEEAEEFSSVILSTIALQSICEEFWVESDPQMRVPFSYHPQYFLSIKSS